MGDAAPKAKPPPRAGSNPWMPQLRKRGEKFLSSKYIVILVIILTVTDCALVIAELILDLYSVKQTLITTETQTFKFIGDLKSKYPEDLGQSETVASIFDEVAHATILWNGSEAFHAYDEAKLNQDLHSIVPSITQFKVGSVDSPSSSATSGESTMITYNSGNHTQDAFTKTVIVQDLKGNYSYANTSSHSTPKHRHRRRSRRDFSSRDYPEGRSKFRDVYLPSKFHVEGILRLLPYHRRGVQRSILDHLLNSSAQGFHSCVSQVIRSTKKYTFPLMNDLIDSNSERCLLHKQLRMVGKETACSNVHLLQNFTLFQKHLSSLLSMQLNDIIIAYIPVHHKFSLKNVLRRRTIKKSAHNLFSSQTHGDTHGDKQFKTPKQPTKSHHSVVKHVPKSKSKEEMTIDSMYRRILKFRKPQNSTNHVQRSMKSHHNSIKHNNIESSSGASTTYTDTDTLQKEQDQEKSSRSKRHASSSKKPQDSGHGNGKDVEEKSMRREMHHSRELEIAHKLHYASVFVVSVLLIMVIMKVICKGSNFLKRKIEVFDAVVVVTSVVVDLIFIKGLSEFAVDETIFVLALLLPWRVIRVVNSLVMAVIDHEHVKLRLLYSRKKKLDKTVETLRNETDELKGMLQDVRQFCIKEGIDSTRIDSILGKFAPRRRKDSKFYTLVKLVMSTASINNNDNDSISSSSMENDLRDYANRQSVLNEAASNEGTVSSLRQYLSVPFFSTSIPGPGSSAVSSDQESVSCVGSLDGAGGDPRRSRADSSLSKPSIFITAPPSDEKMTSSQALDIELGEGGQSLCGSDLDGSVGSDGDVEDGDFSDVFEEDEVLGERKLFLNAEEDRDRYVDSDSEQAAGKQEVAFYLGSRASLDKITFLQAAATSTEPTSNDISAFVPVADSVACYNGGTGNSDVIIVPNTNLQPQKFGRFLTVPMCTVPVSAVTTTALLTNTTANNNNNEMTTFVGADIASNTPKTTQGIFIESNDPLNLNNSEIKSNLATAVVSSNSAASCPALGEVTSRSVDTLPRQSSTSEERRKRFASSSPPRIISSLDMEAARSMGKYWMARSLSDNRVRVPSESTQNESTPLMMKELSHKGYTLCPPYGSPVPRRRLPEVRTRRKNYATVSCRSDSSDSDIPKPLLQQSPTPAPEEQQSQECISNVNITTSSDNSNAQHPPRKLHKRRHHSGSIGRKRHSSGEDSAGFSHVGFSKLLPPRQHSDTSPGGRARSESPGVSSMSLLKVPGPESRRRSVDSNTGEGTDNQEVKIVSSSKSMNDVTSDGNGNPFANNIGRDGKILRSSCLSLNSARHKRRGKSPHRVSFKVS